ncbi:MAG: hypothetical protein LBE27_03875 [Deltaproteobacteria bacterium]|jgi:hypothetical protein|nr:hypothetical protein [Deltaproteobacteria bacterium]
MPLAFRVLYTVALIVSFTLGVILHLHTPMARATWYPWCLLNLALMGLVLRELSLNAKERSSYLRIFTGMDPSRGLGSIIFLIFFLALAILYLFLEHLSPRGIGYLLSSFISFGIWAPLGIMLFFGLKLGSPKLSWVDAALSLLALVVSIFIFAMGTYFYQARVLVISIFCLIFMIKGNRLLKVLVASTLALYFLLGVLVVSGGHERFYPVYLWAFAGMSELNAALDLILRQAVIHMAGFWGTGGAYIEEVGLPLSESMGFNCLPYLALVGGVFSIIIYALSLSIIMVSLLLNSLSIRGWAGTTAVSVWFVLAVDQYMSFLAILTPSALILGGGSNGLPFIGSFESGLALEALMLFVFAAKRADTFDLVENALPQVVDLAPEPASQLASSPIDAGEVKVEDALMNAGKT